MPKAVRSVEETMMALCDCVIEGIWNVVAISADLLIVSGIPSRTLGVEGEAAKDNAGT